MDCHDTSSDWTLLGVYKESLQFDDDTFFEQLFKHQGICLWGGDNNAYQFMQIVREYDFVNYECCYQVGGDSCNSDSSDSGSSDSGSKDIELDEAIYIGFKPLEGGDLDLAGYRDGNCTMELSSYSVDDYVNSSTGLSWSDTLLQWNYMMDAYKVCQPCRAYSKSYNVQDSWRRNLVEYYDGQGSEEINGFNCYDDAGYRNCNQCFKFETHTDMEVASSDDLTLATKQGTILSIDVNGTSYGGRSTYTIYSTSSYGDNSSSTTYSTSSYGGSSSNTTYSKSDSDVNTYYSSMGAMALVVMVIGSILASYRHKRRVIITEDHTLDNELLS